MARKKPVKIKFEDLVPSLSEVREVTVELPEFMEIEERAIDVGWSATLSYFDVTCVLRERSEGTIECEAAWIQTRSNRKRTGTHSKAEAIKRAAGWLRGAHYDLEEARKTGQPDTAEPRPATLRLSEAIKVLRDKNLLPGSPRSKKQAPYDRALCIAQTVWSEDPVLVRLNNEHIRRMFRARVLPKYWEDVFGEAAPDELEPFEWPAEFSNRRRVGVEDGRSKPQTIKNDLANIQTALQALVGEPDEAGVGYLQHNPLKDLDFGSYEKDRRAVAGPQRYPAVLRHADEAVDLYRTEGRSWKENRNYTYKGTTQRKTYNCGETLDFVPGMLRYGLVLQFGHPTRPGSLRHIQMEDCARSREELVRVINSLELRKSDHPVRLDYVEVWIHGGIRYRREYSKLNAERLVPHTEDTGIEHDRYVAKRAAWLKRQAKERKQPNILSSPWLFPSPRDPMEPLDEKDQNRLLHYGEMVARQRIAEAGGNPEEIVPELEDTAWYAYRNWWKTIRNAMGWEGNSNAAYVGDWSIRTGATADTTYARLSPYLILGVVEGLTLPEAIQQDEGVAEMKQAARIRPDAGVSGVAD